MSASNWKLPSIATLTLALTMAGSIAFANANAGTQGYVDQEHSCETSLPPIEEVSVAEPDFDSAETAVPSSISEDCKADDIVTEAREAFNRMLGTVRESLSQFSDRFLNLSS